jgi:PEP-CTERM putative exosortase interaction domain
MCKRITVSPTSTLLQHAKPLGSSAGFISWARVAFALAVVSSGLLHSATDAAMIVTIEQQGADVVASYTGSIDLTGMFFVTVGSASNNAIRPSSGVALFQNGVATKANITLQGGNPWTVAPTAFGTSSIVFHADSVSIPAGNAFGFQGTGFFVEPSYVSGTTISGSMTFENVTLASMGINAGDGIMNATFSSGDTLTVNAAVVPEPTSIAFLATGGLAVGVVAAARRRRRMHRSAGCRR